MEQKKYHFRLTKKDVFTEESEKLLCGGKICM
jgi:hypothetical protein